MSEKTMDLSKKTYELSKKLDVTKLTKLYEKPKEPPKVEEEEEVVEEPQKVLHLRDRPRPRYKQDFRQNR